MIPVSAWIFVGQLPINIRNRAILVGLQRQVQTTNRIGSSQLRIARVSNRIKYPGDSPKRLR